MLILCQAVSENKNLFLILLPGLMFGSQRECLRPQEKEVYRWTVRESLKSMLAMGWSIDRTREGESMFQQREMEKLRRVSQASQVLIISSI